MLPLKRIIPTQMLKQINAEKNPDPLVANLKNNLYFVELAEKNMQFSGTEMFSIILTVYSHSPFYHTLSFTLCSET